MATYRLKVMSEKDDYNFREKIEEELFYFETSPNIDLQYGYLLGLLSGYMMAGGDPNFEADILNKMKKIYYQRKEG